MNSSLATDEQLAYINYIDKSDTKLIACAGSGKTKCIIEKMNKLVKEKIYNSENLLMLTFSRFTRDDFIRKVEKYKADYIRPECIKTIDSYAKKLIDDKNEIDVSLLSLRLMKYLENNSTNELEKNIELSKIKILFVDEAQDLNEIQYRICKALKSKLGILINLIGDPNQNIYQFRKSSDKYLTEFEAKTFYLTKNFRSHKGVLDFSNHLRPFGDTEITCMRGEIKGDNKIIQKPLLLFHKSEKDFEDAVVSILNWGMQSKIDLSNFAILSPTRGMMRGHGKSNGLCFLTNVLFKSGIKFKQFYEEAVEDGGTKVEYKPEKNHVNILTYMGSKGLEWDYVIIIDANNCLINKRFFDDEKHSHDRYLLYVACSRAIKNTFVVSSYNDNQYGKTYNINRWFETIPKTLYNTFDHIFNFSDLKFNKIIETENKITKLIDKLDEYQLDNLATIIDYENGLKKERKRIYKNDYTEIEHTHGIYLGKFVEALFNCFNNIRFNRDHKRYVDIENIIDSKRIITNAPYPVTNWYSKNRGMLTWELYEKQKKNNELDKTIINFVESKFSKDCSINDHTLVNDSYYTWYILEEDRRKWIKDVYEEYLNCKHRDTITEKLFNVILISYALDTQHYFHVTNKGETFKYLLDKYKSMFKEVGEYALNTKYEFENSSIIVTKDEFIGEIDIIDNKDRLWEIKCVNDISLKHVLQLLMYNIMYYNLDETLKRERKYELYFLNLLKGEIVKVIFRLNKQKVNDILTIFKSVMRT